MQCQQQITIEVLIGGKNSNVPIIEWKLMKKSRPCCAGSRNCRLYPEERIKSLHSLNKIIF